MASCINDSLMKTYTNIINRAFKYNELCELEKSTILDVFNQYSSILAETYIQEKCIHLDPDLIKLIEFICIRIIYLALNLDEESTTNYFSLSHSSVNNFVIGGWYSSEMLSYEIDILKFCDWNPLRFCAQKLKELDKIDLLKGKYKIYQISD